MKLSSDTLDVLKNFSQINPSIILKKGKVLETMSTNKNIMATATIAEEVPKDAAIYNLDVFIGALSLFDNPSLKFNSKAFNISANNRSIDYHYGNPSAIVAPTKEFVLPEPDISFKLEGEVFTQLIKSASVLELPDLAVHSDGKKMSLVVYDTDVKSTSDNIGDNYSVEIGDSEQKYNLLFSVENMKLLPGDYDVDISILGKGTNKIRPVAQLKNTSGKVTYIIAMELNSEYNEL
jgi:hypothetical protein